MYKFNVTPLDGFNYSRRLLTIPHVTRARAYGEYEGVYTLFDIPIIELMPLPGPYTKVSELAALIPFLNHFVADQYTTRAVWLNDRPATIPELFKYSVFKLYFTDDPEKGLRVYDKPAPDRYYFNASDGAKTLVSSDIRSKVEGIKNAVDELLEQLSKESS